MSIIPVNEKTWEKIVYWSHRYTGVRVAMLTWIAVYLFCYHFALALAERKPNQRFATAIAFSLLLVTLDSSASLTLNAAEPEDEEEKPAYEISVEVESQPENSIAIHSETKPEYILLVKNTGSNTLTELSFQTESYDLYWIEKEAGEEANPEENSQDLNSTEKAEEENEIRHLIPQDRDAIEESEETESGREVITEESTEDGTEDETETETEETVQLPTQLASGETIELVACLPEVASLLDTEDSHIYSDQLQISAKELTEAYTMDLSIELVREQSDSTEQTGGDESNGNRDSQSNEKDDKNIDEEKQEEASSENMQEDSESEDNETKAGPSMMILDRGAGYFSGDTFVGTEEPHYIVQVEDSSTETLKEIVYFLNDQRFTAEVENHIAEFTIPMNTDAKLQIGYCNEDSEDIILVEEYVLCEDSRVEVSKERILNKEEYGQVTITDGGEIKSGINKIDITIDGSKYLDFQILSQESGKLSSGETILQSEILRLDMKVGTHQVEVCVSDNCGNETDYSFEMTMIDNEVISVVIPTTFTIKMLPAMEGDNQVVSDSIVFCNRSDFPVNVDISDVNVFIDKSMPENARVTQVVSTDNNAINDLSNLDLTNIKTCALNFHLLKADGSDEQHTLLEGDNTELTRFTLGASNPSTNVDQLVSDKDTTQVNSDDYAIIKLRGQIGEGSENYWEDDDLKVQIVYHMSRAE